MPGKVPASGFSPNHPVLAPQELGPHPIQQSFKSQSLLCPELPAPALSPSPGAGVRLISFTSIFNN